MALFSRKPKQVALSPCPQCGQLVRKAALECEMCGLDLREAYVRPRALDPDRARPATD